MGRITIATRNYWLTMALSALVFAITIALTATSMAKVRGGDDEGSGFGGTGRSGDFDGSGFGGTGSPAPWLGDGSWDEEGERARQEMDQLRESLRPVDLPEALRKSIDINLQRERTELALVPPAPSAVREPVSTEVADIERRLAGEGIASPAQVPAGIELITPQAMPEAAVHVAPFELAALPESSQAPVTEPVETDAPAAETQVAEASSAPEQPEERLVLPERIQRPELPPIQRMRPAVERITISPPRPQPMRI